VIFKECEEIAERNQKNDLALPQTKRFLSIKEFQRYWQLKSVKKKRGLFSAHFLPCHSFVALPRKLPQYAVPES
jgi:hypothetical protein